MKMRKPWLVLATTLSLAVAQTITPTNFTAATADLEGEDGIKLAVSDSTSMLPISSVLALTTMAESAIPPQGLSGRIILASPTSDAIPQLDDVALISCGSSTGYYSATTVFSQAQSVNVSAILFYSTQADYCKLEGYSGSYTRVYSMKSVSETNKLLQAVASGKVTATIANAGDVQVINGTGGNGGTSSQGASGSSNNPNALGPSTTTAIAMIILYSVTGVITALFLVIIITGAIRAHRHPERYGPRLSNGLTTGRARGLARAMLDTLPIVKFGEREQPKPADVELAESGPADRTATPSNDGNAQGAAVLTEAQPNDQSRTSAEGGIAAAANITQDASPNSLGCSICTEDFEPGQDQRVLPCDHRFHPDCVDPWLLNVSGTCPLCRINLRHTMSDGNDVDEDGNPVLGEGDFEAAPLGPQGTPGERYRISIRRSIMIGLMGAGRPDRMTREERVFALRQLRGQRLLMQRRQEQAAVAETPEEERRARRNLRDVLRRRTATTTPRAAEPSSEGSQADAGDEPARQN